MLKLNEDALICDLAETYNIYDYTQLPASRVAVFALGLRDSSRIKMQLTNSPIEFESMLLAGLFDKVSLLFWSKTKDAEKNRNRPESVVDAISGKQQEESEVVVFASSKEFENYRKQLLEAGEE